MPTHHIQMMVHVIYRISHIIIWSNIYIYIMWSNIYVVNYCRLEKHTYDMMIQIISFLDHLVSISRGLILSCLVFPLFPLRAWTFSTDIDIGQVLPENWSIWTEVALKVYELGTERFKKTRETGLEFTSARPAFFFFFSLC